MRCRSGDGNGGRLSCAARRAPRRRAPLHCTCRAGIRASPPADSHCTGRRRGLISSIGAPTWCA